MPTAINPFDRPLRSSQLRVLADRLARHLDKDRNEMLAGVIDALNRAECFALEVEPLFMRTDRSAFDQLAPKVWAYGSLWAFHVVKVMDWLIDSTEQVCLALDGCDGSGWQGLRLVRQFVGSFERSEREWRRWKANCMNNAASGYTALGHGLFQPRELLFDERRVKLNGPDDYAAVVLDGRLINWLGYHTQSVPSDFDFEGPEL